uniref:Uncharacterized protein n=1 Tax=Manihot esculenta TaxID=3983 RepID=A0A2C9V6P8_MANES
MGIQGTDVAEENSDIIILKDNFASLWRIWHLISDFAILGYNIYNLENCLLFLLWEY